MGVLELIKIKTEEKKILWDLFAAAPKLLRQVDKLERERILRDRKLFQIGVEVTKEMTTWYRRSGILMILIHLGSRALLRQSSGSKSDKIGINIFRISARTFLGRDATADFKLQRSGKRRSVSYFKTQTLSVGFALLTGIGPFKMLCRFFTVHCVPSVIDIVLKHYLTKTMACYDNLFPWQLACPFVFSFREIFAPKRLSMLKPWHETVFFGRAVNHGGTLVSLEWYTVLSSTVASSYFTTSGFSPRCWHCSVRIMIHSLPAPPCAAIQISGQRYNGRRTSRNGILHYIVPPSFSTKDCRAPR